MPVHSALIGHSFVRRAHEHLQVPHSPYDLNLNLSTETHSVQFHGVGGAKIRDLPNLFEAVRATNPRVLLVDLGTNDLASSAADPPRLAKDLYNQSIEILNHPSVDSVVLFLACPRFFRHTGKPQHKVNAKIKSFNDTLRVLCKDKTHPISVAFNHALLLHFEQFHFDGCHLNARGLEQYLKTTRRAILGCSVRLLKS